MKVGMKHFKINVSNRKPTQQTKLNFDKNINFSSNFSWILPALLLVKMLKIIIIIIILNIFPDYKAKSIHCNLQLCIFVSIFCLMEKKLIYFGP